MKIRTQITLVVTIVVAVVVAIAGLVIVLRGDSRDRADIDAVLSAKASTVRTAAMRNGTLPTDGTYAVRLLQGGQLRKQVGSTVTFPTAVPEGFSTVEAGGASYRSFGETLISGAQLQILVSLATVEDRHTDNVLLVDLLVVLAALLSAAGVWFATGLVLRPFQRLLAALRDLGPEDRLPEVSGPREVAELSEAVNGLLVRASARPPSPPSGSPSASSDFSSQPALSSQPSPSAPLSGPDSGERAARSFADPTAEFPRVDAPDPVMPAARVESPPAASAPAASAAVEPSPVQPAPVEAVPAQPPAARPTTPLMPEALGEMTPQLEGLGANLDTLLDHPDMPATQRHLILAAMADEHREMVTLLDRLRANGSR